MKIPINIYEFQKTLIKEVSLDVPEEPLTFSCGSDMVYVSPILSEQEKPPIVGLNVIWITNYFLFEITHFSIYFSSINDLLKEDMIPNNRIDAMRLKVIDYLRNKDYSRGYIPIERFMGGYRELLNRMNKTIGLQ